MKAMNKKNKVNKKRRQKVNTIHILDTSMPKTSDSTNSLGVKNLPITMPEMKIERTRNSLKVATSSLNA